MGACATPARSARLQRRVARRACSRIAGRAGAKGKPVPQSAARRRSAPRALGQARCWSPKWRSPNGPTTARCAIRRSRACARTSRPRRSSASGPSTRSEPSEDAAANGCRSDDGPSRRARKRARADDKNAIAGVVAVAIPTRCCTPKRASPSATSRRTTRAIGEWMLPHLRDRPLTLVRCPNGWERSASTRRTPTRACTRRSRRVPIANSDGGDRST